MIETHLGMFPRSHSALKSEDIYELTDALSRINTVKMFCNTAYKGISS
jgi:hypothetical protein